MTARVFVVAGEVSGDLLAAPLIRELRRRRPDLIIVGVGGPRMAASGAQLLDDTTTWGAIGHVDPLLRMRSYLRRLAAVERAIRADAPALLLLVDFAAFNLRLAERLRGLVPTTYFVPPMVSVRRGNRAQKVARLGMRLLVTLRSEEAAYRSAGADVLFIGHPVLDLVPPRSAGEARGRLGLIPPPPIVGLLPGSRRQEIRALLPVMLRAATLLRDEAQFALALSAEAFRPDVESLVSQASVPVRISADAYDVMAASSVIVTATGTATVEAAVLGTPMVAVYRLPALSWYIAKAVVTVRHAALPNLLAGREVVPELLQDRFTPDAAAAAVRVLLDPAHADRMRAELEDVVNALGTPGAIARAADDVARALDRVAPAGTGG